MVLFCDACHDIHSLTFAQVERIIYTLQGLYHDTLISSETIDDPEPICLLDLDGEFAEDVEMYAEHVQATRDARLRKQKAKGETP